MSTPFYTDDADEVRPWDLQPGETDLGFHYFQRYRDAGPDRSLRAVAEFADRSEATIRILSARHAWVDRVLAFDSWLDRKAQDELLRDRTEMRRRHVRLAMEGQAKIADRLATLDPQELSARDLVYWLDACVKIERQARGEADSRIELTGKDGGPLAVVDTLDAAGRRAMMAAAMSVLAERTGQKVVTGQVVRDELEP